MTHEGGVSKRQASVPAKSCFKAMAKSSSKADCYAQLKNLLPNASQSKTTSEVRVLLQQIKKKCPIITLNIIYLFFFFFLSFPQLALVEESIAYIAYLESLLRSSDQEVNAMSWLVFDYPPPPLGQSSKHLRDFSDSNFCWSSLHNCH